MSPMFFLTYLRRELRHRIPQTVFVAVGLAARKHASGVGI